MEVGFIIAIVVVAVVIAVFNRKNEKPSVSKPAPKPVSKPAAPAKPKETPVADRGGFNGLNKSALSRMTKKSIEEYAKGRFGVDLDRRLTKDKLIAEVLKLEKKKGNG